MDINSTNAADIAVEWNVNVDNERIRISKENQVNTIEIINIIKKKVRTPMYPSRL